MLVYFIGYILAHHYGIGDYDAYMESLFELDTQYMEVGANW